MRNFIFNIMDYLVGHEAARNVLYWSAWLLVCACAFTLDIWLYTGVLAGALLLHICGQVTAVAEALNND